MKRKILCSLLCLMIVIGSLTLDTFAAKVEAKDVDWGLTLTVADVTPTGMGLIMKQSGGNYRGQLEYCDCFYLEVLRGEKWCRVQPPVVIVCNLDPDNLTPNTTTRLRVDWEKEYGALSAGHYRYTKKFFEFDADDPAVGDWAFFSVEFVIMDDHTCQSENQDQICDLCLAIMPHVCGNSKGGDYCEICFKTMGVFRVSGNADWMGSGQPDNDQCIMTEVKTGLFKKVFDDVPPGTYELKITRDGKWDGAYGDEGKNHIFTTYGKGSVEVRFLLEDGVGKIRTFENPYTQPHTPEDEIPKTADFAVDFSAALMLISIAALAVLLRKKEDALSR